jgi:anthranilate phosphoribosyltransferase
MVVYGHDGLDELTVTTSSTIKELRDGEVRTYDLHPKALGIGAASPEDLRGGDPAANAALARQVLDGADGPKADIVVLNAAAGLIVAGMVDDFPAGLELARASLREGAAAAVLERLVVVSQEAKAAEAS